MKKIRLGGFFHFKHTVGVHFKIAKQSFQVRKHISFEFFIDLIFLYKRINKCGGNDVYHH